MNDTGPNFHVPCHSCRHSKHPDGGYCYMFKEKPPEADLARCAQHTGFRVGLDLLRKAIVLHTLA